MPKIDSGNIKYRARVAGVSMKQLADACSIPYGTLMQYVNDFVKEVPQHVVDAMDKCLKQYED